MAIHVVRLGTPRTPGEGVRLGTVRRPPRGVPKSDFARRDFYDVWLPELAPSAPAVSSALAEPWTPARWRRYCEDASHCHRSLLADLLESAGAVMAKPRG
jgi:uncharacterized protein YeaO (DUF488 family)